MNLVLIGTHISPEGYLAIARRHGSEDRVLEFCERHDGAVASNGEPIPGLFEVLNPTMSDGPPAVRDVLRALGFPVEPMVWFYPAPDVYNWTTALPVPLLGDLDENGVCRCGCGYGEVVGAGMRRDAREVQP